MGRNGWRFPTAYCPDWE